MKTEYDKFFNQVGITNENDKMMVLNFITALFDITLEIRNKKNEIDNNA